MSSIIPSNSNPQSNHVNDYWDKVNSSQTLNPTEIDKMRKNLENIANTIRVNNVIYKLSFNQLTGEIVTDYDGMTRWIVGGLKNIASSTLGYSSEWSKDITHLPSFIKFVERAILEAKKEGDQSLVQKVGDSLHFLELTYGCQKKKENSNIVHQARERLNYLDAMLAAEKDGKYVSENINNSIFYDIKDANLLRRIALTAFKQNPLETLKNLSNYGPEVTKDIKEFLTLIPEINPPLDDKTKQELVQIVVTNLRTLSPNEPISENLKPIVEQIDLKTLSLGLCHNLDETAKCELIKSCPHLTTLVIDNYVDADFTNNVLLALKGCKNITSIQSIKNKSNNISNQTFQNLINNLPSLTSLNLSSFMLLDDDAWKVIAEKCPNLVDLDLSTSGIKDKAFINIVKKCKKLETIKLEQCALSSEIIRPIADNCQSLKNFSISEDNHYPNSAKKPRINNVDLVYLADNCKNLTSLNIQGYKGLQIDPLRKVLESPRNSLMELNIKGCENISTDQITEVKNKFPNVTIKSGKEDLYSGFSSFHL